RPRARLRGDGEVDGLVRGRADREAGGSSRRTETSYRKSEVRPAGAPRHDYPEAIRRTRQRPGRTQRSSFSSPASDRRITLPLARVAPMNRPARVPSLMGSNVTETISPALKELADMPIVIS